MLEATAQIGEIASWLLTEHRFDLFAMALGTPPRAGHYLFALSEIDAGALDTATRSLLEGALDDVYVACDEALGRVLSAAGPDARIVVFALHGMGPETGWAEQFPSMLAALDDVGAPPATGTGALYRLKRKIPAGLVQRVMSRLPQALGEAVVPLWSRSMYDWSTTRCFPVAGDLGGFLRINLAGREAQGVVQPGRDYRDLCRRLHDDFLGFRHLDSGEPAVAAVDVVDDLVDRDASRRRFLPDLIVQWGPRSARETSGVVAANGREVRWARGGRVQSGRSGNHLADGWCIVAGAGVGPGRLNDVHDSADLVRTLFSWLDVEAPSYLEGQPIAPLVAV